MTLTVIQKAILAYLRQGWSVVPALVSEKRPHPKYLPHGWREYQTRKSTEDEVRDWILQGWGLDPEDGIAIITGSVSNLVVVDVDDPSWKPKQPPVDDTPLAVKTPRGGYHLYFRLTTGGEVGCHTRHRGQPIDIKSEGGLVIAPPSPGYEIVNMYGKASPTNLPVFRWEYAGGPPETPEASGAPDKIPEGERNDTLTRLAGLWLAEKRAKVLDYLKEVNATLCDPPLPEAEIERIAASITGREYQAYIAPALRPEPTITPENRFTARDITVTWRTVGEIPAEAPRWLIESWIPRGGITIMAGDPGVGKTWAALAFASQVAAQGGKVVYISTEDTAGLLVDRLHKIGVPLEDIQDRIYVLGYDRVPQLVAAHREVWVGIGKALKPDLVIVDSLQSFLPGTLDMHRANEIREALNVLDGAFTNAGVLCLFHLRKSTAEKNIYRVLGSVDFVAKARSVIMIEQDMITGERFMKLVKCNYINPVTIAPVAFTISPDTGFGWTTANILAQAMLRTDEQRAVAEMILEFAGRPISELKEALNQEDYTRSVYRTVSQKLVAAGIIRPIIKGRGAEKQTITLCVPETSLSSKFVYHPADLDPDPDNNSDPDTTSPDPDIDNSNPELSLEPELLPNPPEVTATDLAGELDALEREEFPLVPEFETEELEYIPDEELPFPTRSKSTSETQRPTSGGPTPTPKLISDPPELTNEAPKSTEPTSKPHEPTFITPPKSASGSWKPSKEFMEEWKLEEVEDDNPRGLNPPGWKPKQKRS